MPAYINERLRYEKNSITLDSRRLINDDFLPEQGDSFDFVKRLNLSDNQIVSLNKISELLPKLKILNLNNNNLSGDGIETLTKL